MHKGTEFQLYLCKNIKKIRWLIVPMYVHLFSFEKAKRDHLISFGIFFVPINQVVFAH